MTKIGRWTTGLLMAAIAALPASAATLYGVTGDGGANVKRTLYTLNQSNAASTFVKNLGHTDLWGGEAIAFNPIDRLMYHWAGDAAYPGNIMESIKLATGAQTDIPQSGDSHEEVLAATWDSTNNRFIAWTNEDYQVFRVTPGGTFTLLGAPPVPLKGIAFAGGTLYGVGSSTAAIYTINPATAAVSAPQPVTAPGIGGTISGFNGLATDPDTGILWAILRLNGSGPGNPGARHLGTITPGGVFTSKGVLSDAFATIAFVDSPSLSKVLDTPYQVRYASNLTQGDSVVNITNTGANGNNHYGPGFGSPQGNICVNVYAFSPDEQLISCCSCLVTPNGLVHVTANNDLVSNTLTGIRPNSIVIKLVATGTGKRSRDNGDGSFSDVADYSGSTCTNSAALAGDQFKVSEKGGLLAWGTTLHSSSNNDPPTGPASSFSITETPFVPAYLSKDELKSITNRCANIIGNGSSFGICRSCRLGGLGGSKL